MSGYTSRLTTQQRSYNQAVNDYLDRPSDSTLRNLKIAHKESGMADDSLVRDLAQRHVVEKKVDSWDPTKTRSYSTAPSDASAFKVKEFAVQRLMEESKPVDIQPEGTLTGLKNLGNTCFGNATLQAFVLTAPEMDTLLTAPLVKRSKESPKQFQDRKNLQTSLKALRDEYQKPSPSQSEITSLLTQVWTNDIFKSAGLNPMSDQEDAPEFLRIVLDSLDAYKRRELSFVEYSELKSTQTGAVKHKRENPSQLIAAKGLDPKNPTLQNTLDFMFQPETIEHKTYNQKRIYYRTADFDGNPPKSLAVQLPRFSVDGSGKKVKTRIKGFDAQVTIPFADGNGVKTKDGVYEVASVVCHYGKTSNSGHYVTIVRTEKGWEERNDSYVRPISEEQALSIIEKRGYLVRLKLVS